MLRHPPGINGLRGIVGIGAVEEHDALGPRAVPQQAEQVALGLAGLGEDDGLFRRAEFAGLGKGDVERLEQGLALGIVIQREREAGELVQIGDLRADGGAVGGGQRFGRIVAPFLGGFVERFVVLIQLVLEAELGFVRLELGFQAVGNGGQRPGDGEGRGGEEFPQHQGHQRALAGRQSLEILPPEVIGNEVIELVLALVRIERLDHGMAFRERHVLRDLATQGAVANRFEPCLERIENLLLAEIGELIAETAEIAEGVIVDDADEAEEFEQGVLQRSGGEQELVAFLQGSLEHVGDDVRGLVNIPQPVGFVDHHEIPRSPMDIGGLVAGKLVGANDHRILLRLEGTETAHPDRGVVGLRLQNGAGQEEFLVHLLMPLFPEIRGRDDENPALPLRPFLGNDQPGFDGFSQADLVCEDRPLRKRRAESEQRGVYLVGIQVHLSASHRACKLLHAVRGAAFREFIGEVFCLIIGDGHFLD